MTTRTTLRMIGLAGAVALVPGFALAQGGINFDDPPPGRSPLMAPQPNNSQIASGMAARDGCVNVPGQMHNSADCSRIDPSDYNTARNSFTTEADGRITGATENAQRNERLAREMSYDRGYDRRYDPRYDRRDYNR